jgi:putative flippase GtrA
VRSRLAEIARFLVGGATTTAISYALYLLLLQWLDYGIAYTISYVVGIFVSYGISTWFVFRTPWSWRSLMQFPIVYVIQYAIGIAVVWLGVEWLGLPPAVAPLLAIIASIPVTYLLSRRIIKPSSAAPMRDSEA